MCFLGCRKSVLRFYLKGRSSGLRLRLAYDFAVQATVRDISGEYGMEMCLLRHIKM